MDSRIANLALGKKELRISSRGYEFSLLVKPIIPKIRSARDSKGIGIYLDKSRVIDNLRGMLT